MFLMEDQKRSDILSSLYPGRISYQFFLKQYFF